MTALEALKRYFGYDEFRGGQETLINGILAGKDVLGIMPTGAGKSICFQVPSLMMDGIALVVSPLISLMKDQVNALTRSGVAAAYINTSLTQGQIDRALRNAVNGAYKLIYVAPERLPTREFISFARSVNISMLAVDEAHCISQWGQDFRPSYTRIPEFIARLPRRPVVSAFTATATPKVRADILALLNLRNPQILIAGFDRKNLYLGARKPKNKYEALAAFLKEREGRSGIVYCGTRSYVEILCKRLRADGYSVSRYHAGLLDKERHDNQDDFLRDRVKIMVATNAFGMGIDKSNVSFVLHLNMPKDIESYYQEAGRAGRDGEPAECVLFYSDRDIRMNSWLLENDKEFHRHDRETGRRLKERSLERMKEMVSYSTTTGCLRGFILKYFGETPPERCGNCDRCNNVAVTTGEINTVKKAAAKKPVAAKKKPVATKTADRADVGAKEKATAAKHEEMAAAREKAAAAKLAERAAKEKAAAAKIAEKAAAKEKAAAAKLAERAAAKEKDAAAKLAEKSAAKEKDAAKKTTAGTAPNARKKNDTVAYVKITDKPVPVSAIAERINCYLAPLNRQLVSAAGINEWLVSEGCVDTINDKGKNRKISTDKGVSIGIVTEIRKVGGERLRVNQFNRKAQEMVVAKYCGAAAFEEGYEGMSELARELCSQFAVESIAAPPDEINDTNEVQGIEREAPIVDEQGIDSETPVVDELNIDEQSIDDETSVAIDEHDADVETPPPQTEEPSTPPRTIFSIIADALKSIGRIFYKR